MYNNFFCKIEDDYKRATAEQLKGAVRIENNKFGEITEEEYKIITGVDFII